MLAGFRSDTAWGQGPIADHPSQAVKFESAAGLQELTKPLARTLDARFSSGEGESQALGQLAL